MQTFVSDFCYLLWNKLPVLTPFPPQEKLETCFETVLENQSFKFQGNVLNLMKLGFIVVLIYLRTCAIMQGAALMKGSSFRWNTCSLDRPVNPSLVLSLWPGDVRAFRNKLQLVVFSPFRFQKVKMRQKNTPLWPKNVDNVSLVRTVTVKLPLSPELMLTG